MLDIIIILNNTNYIDIERILLSIEMQEFIENIKIYIAYNEFDIKRILPFKCKLNIQCIRLKSKFDFNKYCKKIIKENCNSTYFMVFDSKSSFVNCLSLKSIFQVINPYNKYDLLYGTTVFFKNNKFEYDDSLDNYYSKIYNRETFIKNNSNFSDFKTTSLIKINENLILID